MKQFTAVKKKETSLPNLFPRSHALRGNAYQSLQDIEQPASARNHENLIKNQ
ncbi:MULTISPECIES: hypothetical protein [Gammaproteobacteria]|uniref:hypothetical protein n=1 Tax=Gammaproteobacteria TaxID=1236 RepID=UPI001ADAF951|nr:MULTISPECIES: hypothetical protein [Gammaproteobacteria]MBO9482435.1 hypothetical protein [Salinisphaera sp. G21_0]MBO9493032.1 hypothetical protein [Thalassotalea sp. G20_0]